MFSPDTYCDSPTRNKVSYLGCGSRYAFGGPAVENANFMAIH